MHKFSNYSFFSVLFVFILFFSCKRELVLDSNHRTQQQGAHTSEIVENRHGFSASADQQGTLPKKEETHVNENKSIIEEKKNSAQKKERTFVQKFSPNKILINAVTKRIANDTSIKKEVDPRKSRGLWMTIFGGIATTLGIIFMGYAPTGLFVFVFGIVFLVGLITLIMYWANPKPKM